MQETSSESSVTSVGYSTNLIEAAEDTIEENHEHIEDSSLKIQELEGLKVEQEARITDLENESNITSICLENLRNDLMILNSNFDSQVSASKLLEQRATNLEKLKCEMELSLFETEEENIKLLERVSDLESQLTRVKDEHEVTRMECEYVKSEKQKLQESAENLIDECNKLQKSYEDITNGNAELYEQYSRMVSELTSETEMFRKEVEDLKKEISRLDEQKSKLTSEKVNLESSVKETIENEIQIVRKESEHKIQDLTTELASVKQSHKKLMANHEKKSKLLTSYKTRENNLELKLTVSEHERQQLVQEAANLKNEILDSKKKLEKLMSEKSNLEASLNSVSNSSEELKAEKRSFFNKMSELKDSKNASHLQDADMKNEISRVKSVNLQYRLKIQQLEGEKKELLKKIEDLQLLSAKSKKGVHETRSQEDTDYSAKIKMLETELHEALDANNKYKVQLQKLKSKGRNSLSSGNSKVEGEVVTKERFEKTKSSLETELKDLRDRYLEMSLKYAEVEAEKGDLVMQLKTNNARKRVQLHENP
ncbi:uncharacterized protein LOC143551185 [Bidens hawaiensis]|uniref:uncharacterized protein LOC143551185 n=1 Tax=Bidens hawaiensis TaxID=980011 RepID=UPI004049E944